jgi:hypothetical protein
LIFNCIVKITKRTIVIACTVRKLEHVLSESSKLGQQNVCHCVWQHC